MSADRIDELLALALDGADLPADVSAEERGELELLLRSRSGLAAPRTVLDEELSASMPVARARFQRFLAAESRTAAPVPVAKAGRRFWPTLGLPRFAAVGAPVIALGVLAALAFFALTNTFGNVETAVALEEGDYVQFEGVIDTVSKRDSALELTLKSGAGSFRVAVAGHTRIVRDGAQSDPSSLTPGTAVVIDGLVSADRKVVAGNVLFAPKTPPPQGPLRHVEKDDRAPIRGTIVLFRAARDGLAGEIVLELGSKRRVLVPIDGRTSEALLRRFSTALGETVTVVPLPGTRFFRVELSGASGDLTPPTPAGGRPALISLRGIVREFTPDGAIFATREGIERVILSPDTRILAQASGLTPEQVRERRPVVGHGAVAVGYRDEAAGGFVANLVIIGEVSRLPDD